MAKKAVSTQPRPFLLDYCTRRIVAQLIVHFHQGVMVMGEFLSSGSGDMTFWGIASRENIDFDKARWLNSLCRTGLLR